MTCAKYSLIVHSARTIYARKIAQTLKSVNENLIRRTRTHIPTVRRDVLPVYANHLQTKNNVRTRLSRYMTDFNARCTRDLFFFLLTRREPIEIGVFCLLCYHCNNIRTPTTIYIHM